MPNKRIGLASDIDGTLVFHRTENFSEDSGKPDTYTKEGDLEAIRAWQAKGGLFGLCSGRPVASVFNLFSGIRPDFYIACSGAAIFDQDKKPVYEAVIEKEEVRELFEKYKDSTIFDAFHTDSRDTLYRTRHSGRSDVKEVLVTSLEDLGEAKLYSVSLIFKDSQMTEEACRHINENCPALEAFQNKNSADIVKRGCSKGQGVLLVKERLGIEVMAGIGDSFNDLPMLEAAWPSFTFHNSPEDIQNQVAYVVDSVAEALEVLRKNLSEEIKSQRR